jgi:hypothetical protein
MPQRTECKRGHDLTVAANVQMKVDGRHCKLRMKAAKRGHTEGERQAPCAVVGCERPNEARGRVLRSARKPQDGPRRPLHGHPISRH